MRKLRQKTSILACPFSASLLTTKKKSRRNWNRRVLNLPPAISTDPPMSDATVIGHKFVFCDIWHHRNIDTDR